MELKDILKALETVQENNRMLAKLDRDIAMLSRQLVSPSVTLTEASELTGISRYMIRKALEAGQIKGTQLNPGVSSVGARYSIDRQHLIDWCTQGQQQALYIREGVEL